MSHNYPKLIFFQKGNYGTPFLTIWCHIAWNWFQISKVHYLFIFTSQTNKSPLNWVVLILIKENIILKMQNQDFPPSKTEYVITLLKWLVRLIFFVFGSIYIEALSRWYWQFSDFYFVRSHFSLSRFYPIIFNCPVITASDYTSMLCYVFLWALWKTFGSHKDLTIFLKTDDSTTNDFLRILGCLYVPC